VCDHNAFTGVRDGLERTIDMLVTFKRLYLNTVEVCAMVISITTLVLNGVPRRNGKVFSFSPQMHKQRRPPLELMT